MQRSASCASKSPRDAKYRLVRPDERHAPAIGEIEELLLYFTFSLKFMSLNFNVETIAEQALQRLQPRARGLRTPGCQRAVEGAVRPGRQRDQLRGVVAERGERHMRLVALLRVEIGARGDAHQIAVTRLALGQQYEIGEALLPPRIAAGLAVREIDAELKAGNGLYARLGRLFREFQGCEEVVGVGDGESRLAVPDGKIDQLAERQSPFAQREGRMDMQMDEAGVGGAHRRTLSPAGDLRNGESKPSTSQKHEARRDAPGFMMRGAAPGRRGQ